MIARVAESLEQRLAKVRAVLDKRALDCAGDGRVPAVVGECGEEGLVDGSSDEGLGQGVVGEHVDEGVGLAFVEEFVAELDVVRYVEDFGFAGVGDDGVVFGGGDWACGIFDLTGEEVY